MYGIRRLTREVDMAKERLAELEAERIQPTPKPTRETMRCKRCGQVGQLGQYPFSTAPSTGLCDDCL
jgi:hypothetical protein